MKISELVTRLNEMKDALGDVEVRIYCNDETGSLDGMTYYAKIDVLFLEDM